MPARGQSALDRCSSSMAARGDGGNWGQHQFTSGWRSRSKACIRCALKDFGEERKPCRYSRCVVFIRRMVVVSRRKLSCMEFFATLTSLLEKLVGSKEAATAR